MAKIRNTYTPNVWGGGNEKEITLDNGDIYRIRNTYIPNVWGEGNEQEIVKVSSSNSHYIPHSNRWTIKDTIGSIVVILFLLGAAIPIAWFIISFIISIIKG